MADKAQPQELGQNSQGTDLIVSPKLLLLFPSFANCFLAPQIPLLSATYCSDYHHHHDGADTTEP